MLHQMLAIFSSLFVSISPLPGTDTMGPLSSMSSTSSSSSLSPQGSSTFSTPGPSRPEAPAPVAPTEEYRMLWEDADVVGPNTVVITFMGGVAECNSYRAEVKETDKKVTINLLGADDVKHGTRDCIDLGVFYQLTVTTENPVLFKTITQDPVEK